MSPGKVADKSDGRWRPGRRTAIQAAALVAAIVAWRLAPSVDHDHPAKDLATFFTTVAAVNVTLLVSAALYQGALGEAIAFRTRRWIGPESFADFGLSLVAGVLGTVPSWSASVYPFLFGVAAGAGLGGLLTILAMGATNSTPPRSAPARPSTTQNAARRAIPCSASTPVNAQLTRPVP